MANENTTRRGIYIPADLDNWYKEISSHRDIKINTIILTALNEYKDRQLSKGKRNKTDSEKETRKIVFEVLKEKGLI